MFSYPKFEQSWCSISSIWLSIENQPEQNVSAILALRLMINRQLLYEENNKTMLCVGPVGTTLQTNIVCQCCLNTSCETLLQHKKISCAMFAQSAQSSFSRTITVAILSSSAWINIVHPQSTSNFTQENNLHCFLYLCTPPPLFLTDNIKLDEILRGHPQMHLVWDRRFFLLFSEPPPPILWWTDQSVKVLISNTQYEKYLNAKSS